MAVQNDDLVQLQLTSAAPLREVDQQAANGAPTGEPEAWNANVAVYTPLQGHTPEPAPVAVSPSSDQDF